MCRLEFDEDAAKCGIKRNAVMSRLNEVGIATRQGTHAVHKLDYYRNRFGYKRSSLPEADMCDECTISLPLFVSITEQQQQFVAEQLLRIVEAQRKD